MSATAGGRPCVVLLGHAEPERAAGALRDLGLDVRVAARAPARSPRDALAILVVEPDRTADLASTLRHARDVTGLPLLVLAARPDDDVLLQELSRPGEPGPRPVTVELACRIRAALRGEPAGRLTRGVLEIDVVGREVRVGGRVVGLAAREFDLLVFLASSPGRVFTRDEILRAVWPAPAHRHAPSTVTEHVRRLRRKLAVAPGLPQWLTTVRNVGYRFDA